MQVATLYLSLEICKDGCKMDHGVPKGNFQLISQRRSQAAYEESEKIYDLSIHHDFLSS